MRWKLWRSLVDRTVTFETLVLPATLTTTRWSRDFTCNETGTGGQVQAPTFEWMGSTSRGLHESPLDPYPTVYAAAKRASQAYCSGTCPAVAAPGGFVLGTLLSPGLPVAAADLSAFSNADLQYQTYTADYWSLEVNRTLVGWDVAKLLAGVRYISYEEQYAYYSQNATEAGLLLSDVDNQMFGLQVGMDLLYPISNPHTRTSESRLGGFINFADSNVFLDNAGNRVLATGDDGTETRRRVRGW